jgi:hypothetical protein
LTLAPQESTVVAFAIVGGTGLDELKTNMASAQTKYDCMCTSIEEEDEEVSLPDRFSLFQNYPNPFNPATTIAFELRTQSQALAHTVPPGGDEEALAPQREQASRVFASLKIYNIRGQLVKTLIEDELTPGRYQITWDGTDGSGEKVASGVYLYRLKTSQSQTTRRMILLK